MRAFLSMADNRAVDEYAIETCDILGRDLMQNAGDAVVDQMHRHGYLDNAPQVVILAGHGNNGGDGFVIAAELQQAGVSVSVILTADQINISGDALYHFQRLSDLHVQVQTWADSSQQQQQIRDADVIVDALLGTGIKGRIRAPYDSIIKFTNQSNARRLAVDVPSGVTGDLGDILDPCIRADLTVSMGFGKQGCLFEPARSHSGSIVPVDIGFPSDSIQQITGQVLLQNENQDYPRSRYVRFSDTHKYSAGKVFIIAGSQGFTGAALLASTAALRSGSGLVRLALPASLGQVAESYSLETVVDYLPETEDHGISMASLEVLKHGCEWADTVVVGPGLGRNPETMEVVHQIIQSTKQPLVIDADALFALNEDSAHLSKRPGPTIITPHAGEFKRLIQAGSDYSPSWRDAQKFAIDHGVSVLLKGAPSLLASPSGKVIVNSTGYAGMATAGSGDVLSGVIASLWAQWPQDEDVLAFAMYIHGKAAELNREQKGVLGLLAGDIVEALPQALKEYGGLPS